ncbi:uncharacterized protein LOC114732086 [Neltuma alba]|uniref:uncharacterized protein LOC114732086 n=1 Tax=Neltuma alba TaxID=207710 RepID=UPI0010A4A849|nr:uncharacterized protein LOC114732086 [Prosopis alba]
MGLRRSLAMLVLVLLLYFEWFPHAKAQSSATNGSSRSARDLDALLQDYAYMALMRPVTGKIYDGTVPSNLTGINIAALRLRSGSLRRRGVDKYKEFNIPMGLIETPYVVRLVLVYQNLGNWSRTYYQTQLPNYTFLAPVLGLLAYDGTDLSATNLHELNIIASGDPISIKFDGVRQAPDGAVARCVLFDLQGSFNFSNVTEGNTCSTSQQGHFSIVTESIGPSPSPAPGPGAPVVPPAPSERAEKKSSRKVGIIVGSVLGGLALLVLLSLLVLWVQKFKKKKRRQQMEREAEVGEALHMAPIGDTKAPAASGTRTQPALEHEYAP